MKYSLKCIDLKCIDLRHRQPIKALYHQQILSENHGFPANKADPYACLWGFSGFRSSCCWIELMCSSRLSSYWETPRITRLLDVQYIFHIPTTLWQLVILSDIIQEHQCVLSGWSHHFSCHLLTPSFPQRVMTKNYEQIINWYRHLQRLMSPFLVYSVFERQQQLGIFNKNIYYVYWPFCHWKCGRNVRSQSAHTCRHLKSL